MRLGVFSICNNLDKHHVFLNESPFSFIELELLVTIVRQNNYIYVLQVDKPTIARSIHLTRTYIYIY